MIEIDKIERNTMYQQCKKEVINNSKIDIEENCKEVSKKAIEIAKALHVNSEIIRRAILFTYLGLYTQSEDYIKVSGALAVRILTQLGENEDTVAGVLMAIAGQGNKCNSINVFSAIILLANFIELKSYLILNNVPEELANSIKVKKFDIVYDKKEIYCEIEACRNKETNEILDYIEKILENCANVLTLKIAENVIVYI